MRTLLISDLHLGSGTRADLLRRAALRRPLIELLGEVDRLVLLGDVIELRHGPAREALAAARPVFEELGAAMATGEIVLVAGNHDHGLIEPWLARRGEDPAAPALEPEQLLEPADASPGYERLARWCAPARVRVAYPGLWLRPDVYATHGHYLDVHLTVPTLERLSVGVMARVLGMRPEAFTSTASYESVGAPVFAWRDAVARDSRTGAALNGLATVGAWRALGGAGPQAPERRPRRILASARRSALLAGFPLAIWAINRAGIGPVSAEISAAELRSAGLRAMGEVAARMGLGDAYVIFGHTHRPGPLPADAEHEWSGRAGARLLNTGSWTYASIFLSATAEQSPYWPGTAVLVEEQGAPQIVRLLHDRTRAELRGVRAAA